jgi:hypothetical protein
VADPLAWIRSFSVVKIAVVALAILPLALFAGAVLSQFDLPLFQIQSTMEVRATIDGPIVRAAGTTTLVDGAVVACYLVRDDRDIGNTTLVPVANRAFSFDTPLPWPTGRVALVCNFGVGWAVQPKVVTDTYGSRAERMAGPNVYSDTFGTAKTLYATFDLGQLGGAPAGSQPEPGPS